MYDLFTGILNMSLSASCLVIVVMAVRVILKKIPRKYICMLWMLVAIRLVCPICVSSDFSVFNLIGAVSNESGQIEYLQHEAEDDYHNWFIKTPEITDEGINMQSGIVLTTENNSGFVMLVVGIWLLGMIVMFLFMLISYIKFCRDTRASACLNGNVYICDDINSPFVLGIFRPRIMIPSGLTEIAYSNVLAHEGAHIRRLDHIWKPLGYVLLAVYWFNPLFWLAYILLGHDIENACDELVVANMDKEKRGEYLETLLAFAANRRRITVCPVAFGETDVKERIKKVLKYKKPALWLEKTAAFICLILAATLLTNPKVAGAFQNSMLGSFISPTPSQQTQNTFVGENSPIPTEIPRTENIESVADSKGFVLDGRINGESTVRLNCLFESRPSFFKSGFALIESDNELWAYKYDAPRTDIYERCEFNCCRFAYGDIIFAKTRELMAGAFKGYYFIHEIDDVYYIYFWGNSNDESTFARAKAGDYNEALRLVKGLYEDHTEIFAWIPEKGHSEVDVDDLHKLICSKKSELFSGTSFAEYGIMRFKFAPLDYSYYIIENDIESFIEDNLLKPVIVSYQESLEYVLVEAGDFAINNYKGKYVVGFNECSGAFRLSYYLDNGNSITSAAMDGYYLDLMKESFQKFVEELDDEK